MIKNVFKGKAVNDVAQLEVSIVPKTGKNASQHTICSYQRDIWRFVEFVDNQDSGVALFVDINPLIIRSYLAFLKSKQYAKATIMRRIAALRSFFRFLCREIPKDSNHITGNFIRVLDFPGR